MTRASLIGALVLSLLGGCTIPVEIPGPKACRAEAAIGYVGQRYTQRIGRTVKSKTLSRDIRLIAPDTMVTQDYRADRLNITVDDRNLITRIYCG